MPREMVRQGGRSARIQKAVHAAVRALSAELDRAALTVPMIADRAGVTPSTIYRRWGDLGQLLADVAVERLRPIADPDDTGSTGSDIEAFILQYAEEMSSKLGKALLRDILAESESDAAAVKCCQFTYQHLELIADRAAARYHILFNDRAVDAAYCHSLLAGLPLAAARIAA